MADLNNNGIDDSLESDPELLGIINTYNLNTNEINAGCYLS